MAEAIGGTTADVIGKEFCMDKGRRLPGENFRKELWTFKGRGLPGEGFFAAAAPEVLTNVSWKLSQVIWLCIRLMQS